MIFIKSEQGEYINIEMITYFNVEKFSRYERDDPTYTPIYSYIVLANIKDKYFILNRFDLEEDAQASLDSLMVELKR